MANKNTTGSLFTRFKNKEVRLLKCIDKRTNNGKDRENVDPTYYECSFAKNGERVWSY
jgi:hypothetical protein